MCIKVDREERPDIDGIYMRVCQMMTGSGGWPLTVVMTPDRRPFFAATYIPKESRWGRMGLVELIPRLRSVWETRRDEVEKAAAETVAFLKRPQAERGDLPVEELLSRAAEELGRQFDHTYGGFGDAPKFPMPHQLLFLMRHWRRTGEASALRMADGTLAAMRRGGIYDQLGFGFHRYSTDRQWLVPHFEKMLYDQALLALAYAEAFQATGNAMHARTLREILDYCLRDLLAPEGGFFTAEDADSEGEEGRFYVWSLEEIRWVLDPEEVPLAAAAYGLAQEGNFVDPVEPERRGRNILHLSASPKEIAKGLGMTERAFLKRLEAVRLKLLAVRGDRVRPGRDDKILTDWNGLMIAALARAARVLDEPRYLEAARTAIGFIRARLKTADGRLLHRFCKGDAAMTANLDDYAFLIWGLIETYEAGFDAADLGEALALQGIVDGRFRDPDGGFFSTPDDGEKLLFRAKEGHDGAVPSGNAVTLMNLIRLGRMTGDAAPGSGSGGAGPRLRRTAHADTLRPRPVDDRPGTPRGPLPRGGDRRGARERSDRRDARGPQEGLPSQPDAPAPPRGGSGRGDRRDRPLYPGDAGRRRPHRRLRLHRICLPAAGHRSPGAGGAPQRGGESLSLSSRFQPELNRSDRRKKQLRRLLPPPTYQ